MSLLAAVLIAAALPQAAVAESGKVRDLDNVEVRDLGQLADVWTLDTKQNRPPNYSRESLANRSNGCVAIGFRIEADGSTSQAKVLEVFSDKGGKSARKEFANGSLFWAQRLQYAPVGTPTPVYTYEITAFQIVDPLASAADGARGLAELKQRCTIKDFPERIHSLLKP